MSIDALEPRSVRLQKAPPFDHRKLDDLLDVAGIDVVLVTSRQNIQYALGYWFFFFDNFDAIGISRYLPILVYPKGRPEDAAYIGNSMEGCEAENGRFWCPTVITKTSGTLDAAGIAVEHLRRLGLERGRIGIESAFMPVDAADALRAALPGGQIVDAHLPLERLRAIKRPDELALIREASERVVDAMVATFSGIRPAMTKREVSDLLREEEGRRGLRFDYCLITAGTSFNRSPNGQVLRQGDIISLDSGGSYRGFFGDLCRMGIVGEPDRELNELLAFIDRIQQAAREPIRPGTPGKAIFAAVAPLLEASPLRAHTHFVAHGMGIIGHEAPRLIGSGPVKYSAIDADKPLLPGMVLSVETTLPHPERGYIKLEDTLAVTETGWEGYGDGGRGWNRAGA